MGMSCLQLQLVEWKNRSVNDSLHLNSIFDPKRQIQDYSSEDVAFGDRGRYFFHAKLFFLQTPDFLNAG